MERAGATSETATQTASMQAPAQRKVPAGGEAEAKPTTTMDKLTRGFAQMTGGAAATQTLATQTSQAQEQSLKVGSQPPGRGPEGETDAAPAAAAETAAKAAGEPKAGAPAGSSDEQPTTADDGLSPEERRRRTEQSAGDRARHQQQLEAQRRAELEKQREEIQQRRATMKALDDEMLGAEARRELERQELREELLEEVRPAIEQQTTQNTRILVASELIEALGDEEAASQIVARSREWQGPTDFYAAYRRTVAEGAVKTFREKELPRLLEQARQAGRHEAEAEREDLPVPQFESALPSARRPTNPADKLSLGLARLRKER